MWILIGIQNPSIMERHALNWNIWKGMKSLGSCQKKWYSYKGKAGSLVLVSILTKCLPDAKLQSAYPHIAIVDPATGNQAKPWPDHVPKARGFLRDIHGLLNSRVQDQLRMKDNQIWIISSVKPLLSINQRSKLLLSVPTLSVCFSKFCADLVWLMTKELCLLASI